MSSSVAVAKKPAVEKQKVKIINTQDMVETKIRVLLYGASGSGKTHSALTIPKDRLLVLRIEPKQMPLLGQGIDVIPVDTWRDIQTVFAFIRDGLASAKGLIVNGKAKDIIFIDSLSEANELCKAQIIAKDRPELMIRQKKIDIGGIYEEQLTMQDWGLLSKRMNDLVSAFCHLPCHIIFTCLEKWAEDKSTGEMFFVPDLNGKLPLTIPHHFDLLHRLEIHTVENTITRLFRTQPSEKAIAKGSPKLETHEKPNWTTIITKLYTLKAKEKKQ